jgi:hypothetical protein
MICCAWASCSDRDGEGQIDMIPQWMITPLFLFSVCFIGFQHTQIENRRNILNVRFGMAVGGVIMAVLSNVLGGRTPWASVVFFVLALAWIGAGIRLWRLMPPKPPRSARF